MSDTSKQGLELGYIRDLPIDKTMLQASTRTDIGGLRTGQKHIEMHQIPAKPRVRYLINGHRFCVVIFDPFENRPRTFVP
jgi:hypothetical protein